jgi:hypothetical protein
MDGPPTDRLTASFSLRNLEQGKVPGSNVLWTGPHFRSWDFRKLLQDRRLVRHRPRQPAAAELSQTNREVPTAVAGSNPGHVTDDSIIRQFPFDLPRGVPLSALSTLATRHHNTRRRRTWFASMLSRAMRGTPMALEPTLTGIGMANLLRSPFFSQTVHYHRRGKPDHLAQQCRLGTLLQKLAKGDLVVGDRGDFQVQNWWPASASLSREDS